MMEMAEIIRFAILCFTFSFFDTAMMFYFTDMALFDNDSTLPYFLYSFLFNMVVACQKCKAFCLQN